MANYEQDRIDAYNDIKEAGATVELSRTTKGARDPLTGGTIDTVTTHNGVGVFLSFNSREINGTTVLNSDVKMLYAGDLPKIGDIVSGKRIEYIKPLDPDLTGAIIYTCGLRV